MSALFDIRNSSFAIRPDPVCGSGGKLGDISIYEPQENKSPYLLAA